MSKKKRIILGSTLIFLCMAIICGIILVLNREEVEIKISTRKDQFEEFLHIEIDQANMKDVALVREDEIFWVSPFINSQYIYLREDEVENRTIRDTRSGNRETYESERVFIKADLKIYDIVQMKQVDTIDVLELINQHVKGYTLDSSWPAVYPKEDGDIHLVWRINNEQSITTDLAEQWYMSMNFRTGEVTKEKGLLYPLEFTTEETNYWTEEISIFDRWNQQDDKPSPFLLANGFTDGSSHEWVERALSCGYGKLTKDVRIAIPTADLPKENKKLYTKFPELKEFIGKEDLMTQIILMGQPTSEEIFELFLEEGQEISFSGCVLLEEDTIDGQEHQISSFEDYRQWIKPKDLHDMGMDSEVSER